MCSRPVCLPVMCHLWRPGGEKTKVELAAAMILMLSACHSRRTLHVVADAPYHGRALRDLSPNVSLTTRLPKNAVRYALAPPKTRRPGRPRLKGERLGTAAELAARLSFQPAHAERYRRRESVLLAEIRCLWYGSLHTRTVRLVIVRDTPDRHRPDLYLVTTDLTTPAAELVARYAARWAIEVTFAEARERLGAGQARNRVRRAVERTVPFALYCYTITVIWYTLHCHHPDDAADHRRRRAPWYAAKAEQSFADMIAKLRRVMIASRFSATDPAQPTPDVIREVQHAWAAASANTPA